MRNPVSMKYLPLLFILLISCHREDREAAAVRLNAPPAMKVSENDVERPPEEQENMLIKTADYKIQVESVEKSTKNIQALAEQYEASVAEMNLTTTNSELTNNLVIRVPANRFEKLIDELGKEAVFTNYKKIAAEDITEEFVDIEIRLKTKKEVRDRYIDILKNKARTVEDVLKAEEQIRILQEEIEAKEGRLKYLRSKVSMSTIKLEIYQRVDYKDIPDVYEKSYLSKFKNGLANGWALLTGISLFLVNVWPLLIIGVLIYWRRKWFGDKLFPPRK